MLLQADAYKIPLPDRSVHCCVTSPPYWGLRKYSGDQGRGEFPDLGLEKTPEEHIERMVSIFREIKRVLRDDGVVWLNYGDCYASGQIVRRDTVIGGGDIPAQEKWQGLGGPQVKKLNTSLPQGNLMLMPHRVAIALQDDWIVRNDLIWFKRNPMPESVAGWRYEKDMMKKGSWRHTRAHEYIFQLVKKMGYYCNQEAVRVAHDPEYLKAAQRSMGNRTRTDAKGGTSKDFRIDGAFDKIGGFNEMLAKKGFRPSPGGRNPRSVLDIPTAPYKGAHYATFPPNLIAPLIRASCPRRSCPECGQAWAPVVERNDEYRQYLSRPFMDAISPAITGNYIISQREKLNKTRAELAKYFPHYKNKESIIAQFSNWELGKNIPSLKDWLILKNILNLDNRFDEAIETYHISQRGTWSHELQNELVNKHHKDHPSQVPNKFNIIDYRPTCSHNHDPIPGIVLDPFIGSGTTGAVARELQRRWIGLDISMDYIDQQAKVRALRWTPSNALDQLPLFKKETVDD